MTQADAQARYGQINMNLKVWPGEERWMELVTLPQIIPTWINSATGTPVTRIYCNVDMKSALLGAIGNVIARGLTDQLKTFDGCFNVRFIRGSLIDLSAHCYGMAIDINVAENPLGSVEGGLYDQPDLVDCFTSVGFTWGAKFSRPDPQHFALLPW